MSIICSSTHHNKVSGDEGFENASSPGFRDQSCLEKMVETKKDAEELKEKLDEYRAKIAEIKLKLVAEDCLNSEEKQLLEIELLETEKEINEILAKVDELPGKSDRSTADPGANETFDKSQTNKAEHCEEMKPLTEENSFEYRLEKFWVSNKSVIEKFGMLTNLEESQQFLLENHQLCCEEMLNALLIQCYNCEIEEKHYLLENVARQTILFQRMLEFSSENSLDMQSSSFISSFFDKFPLTDQLRIEKFEAEVNNLKENVLAISALIVEEIKGTQSERLILESLPEENEESFNEMENVDMKMSPDLSSN